MILAVLVACQGAGPMPVAEVRAEVVEAAPTECQGYASFVESFEICVARLAPGLDSVDEVNRHCPLAGGMELDCRWRWITTHLDQGRPIDELLAACGSFDDCRLTALDKNPSWSIDEQLDRCKQYAGKYGFDCASHAMQRWYATLPTHENMTWLANHGGPWPDVIGNYVAAAIACDGLPGCVGTPDVLRACETALPIYLDDLGRCEVMKTPHEQ